MNRFHIVVVLAIMMVSFSITAQKPLILKHARPIDPDRYERIKGTPYMQEEWFVADITPTAGEVIAGVSVNFNGYTGLFEVRQGDQFIELEYVDFVRIKVAGSESVCGESGFYKYPHPKLHHLYPYFVYNGTRWKLIKDFRITLVEKKMETPGKTEIFKTFNDVIAYYLWQDDQLELVKLNRKDLLERIPVSGAEAYIKENKLNLSDESDVCRFLTWAEGQLWR